MADHVLQFEKNFSTYINTKYAVAVNSCTSALEIALKVLDLKQGDEVIIPAQTFIATGSCVLMAGCNPVFCETDGNFLIDFEDLKSRITDKTKVVIIVHFAGLIHPDILKIKDFLKKRNIFLIEDAAHAHGAKINTLFAGNIGDIGCFSFYSTKIMTTGEGGMITTNDRKLYEKCSSLRNRGIDVSAKSEIFSNVGSNRRFTEAQAILGLYQLKRLEEFIEHRNKIAAIYESILKPLIQKDVICFQKYGKNIRHAYWRFLIFLKKTTISRETIVNELEKVGIKIDFPYTPLLHLQPVFREICGMKKDSLKKTESLAQTHFCLPMHLLIGKDDARFIAKTLMGVLT